MWPHGDLALRLCCPLRDVHFNLFQGDDVDEWDERNRWRRTIPKATLSNLWYVRWYGLWSIHARCRCAIPFPGYDHGTTTPANIKSSSLPPTETTSLNPTVAPLHDENMAAALPPSMYFFLAIPALFDLGATALCSMGLVYLDVSIYQMLRGSGIIFVAMMKHHILKETLQKFHWVGVGWNDVSIVIVGGTAMLTSGGSEDAGSNAGVTPAETLFGVGLLIAGAFVQSCQFVFEEKVMKLDVPVPPLLMIGMEGFWGVFFGMFVMFPIGYLLPGDDHGSYEDPFNTWAMLMNTKSLQVAFAFYFFTIFMYNVLCALVTFQLSSIWHAILDNFRPMTIWATDLFIYYYINPMFGEVWTNYSYLQIAGMAVLLYGTAIYNGPNDGSILLEGQWYAFGIDCSEEYIMIKKEQEQAALEAQWDAKQAEFKQTRLSSFMNNPSRASLRRPI